MRWSRLSRPLFLLLAVLLTVIFGDACDATPTTPSAQPATLSQLSLLPATVTAGATSEGTVTLSGGAPGNGIEVRLSSSDGVAVVPASITLPAGSVTGTFTVTTRVVAADTSATVSALAGGERREVALRVMAPIARPPTLQALGVEPAIFRGGQNAQGTVRLTGAALAAMAVTVRTNNALATVPNSVTVPAGATSATFTVTTRPVTLDTVFDITATLADQTWSVQIRLTP